MNEDVSNILVHNYLSDKYKCVSYDSMKGFYQIILNLLSFIVIFHIYLIQNNTFYTELRKDCLITHYWATPLMLSSIPCAYCEARQALTQGKTLFKRNNIVVHTCGSLCNKPASHSTWNHIPKFGETFFVRPVQS